MPDDDRAEAGTWNDAQLVVEEVEDQVEENQQRDTLRDFRNDHRKKEQTVEQAFAGIVAAHETDGDHGADGSGNDRRYRRDDQAVSQRVEHQTCGETGFRPYHVVENVLIPLKRETAPRGNRTRVVERKYHQQQNRCPKEKVREDRVKEQPNFPDAAQQEIAPDLPLIDLKCLGGDDTLCHDYALLLKRE